MPQVSTGSHVSKTFYATWLTATGDLQDSVGPNVIKRQYDVIKSFEPSVAVICETCLVVFILLNLLAVVSSWNIEYQLADEHTSVLLMT